MYIINKFQVTQWPEHVWMLFDEHVDISDDCVRDDCIV